MHKEAGVSKLRAVEHNCVIGVVGVVDSGVVLVRVEVLPQDL